MNKTLRRVLHPSVRFGAFLVVCLTLTGCTTTGLLSGLTSKNKFVKATPSNPAVRCLCLWEPAEGTGVDDKPARGVAGQIFFFTRSSISPVEVDGDVRIFLFDDQGDSENQTVPLHQFDFKDGSWNAQLTTTQFGPAYQVFVPYSRKGHHLATLALRVRLQPKNGPVIFSDMANVVLHGYDRSKAEAEAERYEPLPRGSVAPHGETSAANIVFPDQLGQAWAQTLEKPREGLRSPSTQALTAANTNVGGDFSVIDQFESSNQPPPQRRGR